MRQHIINQLSPAARADLDWMQIGSNENPYSRKLQHAKWLEYETKFEELQAEYDNAFPREVIA